LKVVGVFVRFRAPPTKQPEKNTKNKALHTKLLNRKNVKLQEEKKERHYA
jgi:hypothetical protein